MLPAHDGGSEPGMKYRKLGGAGVYVSELCLGGTVFGDADATSYMHKIGAGEKASFEIMNRAVDMGINFIDTADVYGNDGLSERVIGAWFERDQRRREVVLATKFRFTMGDGPNRRGASRYRILRCIEHSLKRLRTDHVDLYQVHLQDADVPEEETLRALDDLVAQGKVLYAGCSNYAAVRLCDALWKSRNNHWVSYVTLQVCYNLVTRNVEREHVPLCRDERVGILAYSPLAGGLLTGKYERGKKPPSGTRFGVHEDELPDADDERAWRIVDTVRAVATEAETTPGAVALAWLLTKPAVTSVITGVRTLAQLEANAAACDLELSPAQLARLEEASSFELGYPYGFIKHVQGRL